MDLTELEKRILVLEIEVRDFNFKFDTKLQYILDYFKKVNSLYEQHTEAIVTIHNRCAERLGNCIKELGENKVYSLEGKNKILFQVLNSFLTFVLGLAAGLIMKNGK